jgi:ketosteroid isomerase-like protein
LWPDDEAQIRAVLGRIADGFGGEGGGGGTAGAIGAAARVAALQREFHTDAMVDAGPPFERLVGRQAIISAAGRARASIHNLEIRFPDVDVTVSGDGRTATALVTVEAYFNQAGEQRSIEARELEMAFARADDRWVISQVILLQPLERLDR